jgi:hypothetical protein
MAAALIGVSIGGRLLQVSIAREAVNSRARTSIDTARNDESFRAGNKAQSRDRQRPAQAAWRFAVAHAGPRRRAFEFAHSPHQGKA